MAKIHYAKFPCKFYSGCNGIGLASSDDYSDVTCKLCLKIIPANPDVSTFMRFVYDYPIKPIKPEPDIIEEKQKKKWWQFWMFWR